MGKLLMSWIYDGDKIKCSQNHSHNRWLKYNDISKTDPVSIIWTVKWVSHGPMWSVGQVWKLLCLALILVGWILDLYWHGLPCLEAWSPCQQGHGVHTKLNLAAHAPTDPALIQWESRSVFGMSTKPTGYHTTMCPTLCGYIRETEWVSSLIRTPWYR